MSQKPPIPVLYKQFDTTLPVPEYKTAQAACLDLVARTTVTIAAGKVGYVPLNIALRLPEGYWALLSARSSLHKRGLMLANGIGVGDADFCGDQDEYQAALLNFTQESVTVERGERIAQLMILPKIAIALQQVAQLSSQNRGGIGSTGRF